MYLVVEEAYQCVILQKDVALQYPVRVPVPTCHSSALFCGPSTWGPNIAFCLVRTLGTSAGRICKKESGSQSEGEDRAVHKAKTQKTICIVRQRKRHTDTHTQIDR